MRAKARARIGEGEGKSENNTVSKGNGPGISLYENATPSRLCEREHSILCMRVSQGNSRPHGFTALVATLKNHCVQELFLSLAQPYPFVFNSTSKMYMYQSTCTHVHVPKKNESLVQRRGNGERGKYKVYFREMRLDIAFTPCTPFSPKHGYWGPLMTMRCIGVTQYKILDHGKLKRQDDSSHPSRSVSASPPWAPFYHSHFSLCCGGPLEYTR